MTKPLASHTTPEEIEVGSFFLETLTTGMYEDPFHCIREYVQNGYDAIQDAKRIGTLTHEEGEVLVTVGGSTRAPSLTIRDNGCGIPASRAFTTLVSLGASRKTPTDHAGFRGIGRLAGIAYCTTLRFTTKAAGDHVATIVEFDCGRLRGFFTPGAEPQDVRAVVHASVKAFTVSIEEAEHYTEVQMLGLVNLGIDFTQMEKLQPYLQEVCPVDYVDGFGFAERIRSMAASYGDPIQVIRIAARQRRERIPISKPYRNFAPIGRKNASSTLTDIEVCGSKEHGWYGWIGVSNFPGEIVDEAVAGVRFRVKNIQIGDARIIEDIAEGLTSGRSERRVQRWAVGEIFITNSQVVPNARRDGFEDSQAWRDIRNDIRDQVAARVVKLLRAASKSRSLLKDIAEACIALSKSLNVSSLTPTLKAKFENDIKRHLRILSTPTKLTGADPKEVSGLTSELKGLQEKLASIAVEESPPPSPAPPEPPEASPPDQDEEKTILEVVYEVLSEEFGDKEAERLVQLIRLRLEDELA